MLTLVVFLLKMVMQYFISMYNVTATNAVVIFVFLRSPDITLPRIKASV